MVTISPRFNITMMTATELAHLCALLAKSENAQELVVAKGQLINLVGADEADTLQDEASAQLGY